MKGFQSAGTRGCSRVWAGAKETRLKPRVPVVALALQLNPVQNQTQRKPGSAAARLFLQVVHNGY
jgi:hypothetical protein